MKSSSLALAGFVAVSSALALTGNAQATPTNVALDKSVSISSGTSFNNDTGGDLSIITDGVFLSEQTAYWSSDARNGAVEWGGSDVKIYVELGGLYTISSLKLQADDNDAYSILYHAADGEWLSLAEIGIASDGNGLVTRFEDLSLPITTDEVEIIGGYSHDVIPGYAVSEIQLYGESAQVPEPAGLALLGGALLGAAVLRRRSLRVS